MEHDSCKVKAEGESTLIYGNVYDKYNTTNPIERYLVSNFLSTIEHFVKMVPIHEIHEVGCGEGRLSSLLADMGYRVRGSDASEKVVEIARKSIASQNLDVPLKAASVYQLNPEEDAAELIVCCEVLEHLEDPQRALLTLASLANPYLLVSVPREPLWRVLNMARGKYWGALGNTPGHLQHWSAGSFVRLLESRLDVIKVARPLPWTVALCRRRENT